MSLAYSHNNSLVVLPYSFSRETLLREQMEFTVPKYFILVCTVLKEMNVLTFEDVILYDICVNAEEFDCGFKLTLNNRIDYHLNKFVDV